MYWTNVRPERTFGAMPNTHTRSGESQTTAAPPDPDQANRPADAPGAEPLHAARQDTPIAPPGTEWRPIRCSDVRSMGWVRFSSGDLAMLPSTTLPVPDEAGRADDRGATRFSRRLGIAIAVGVASLATGLASAASTGAQERRWNDAESAGSLAPEKPALDTTPAGRATARGNPRPNPDLLAGYWVPCRRSYHVALGEYWPCSTQAWADVARAWSSQRPPDGVRRETVARVVK
jgi:hypothetical protein